MRQQFVLLCLVAVIGAGLAQASDPFDAISDYLAAHVVAARVHDVGANLKQIEEYRAELQGKPWPFRPTYVVEAIDDLLALSKSSKDCSASSYDILRMAHVRSHWRVLKAQLEHRGATRVDQLVHEFAREHAFACRDTAVAEVRSKLAAAGKDLVHGVQVITETFAKVRIEQDLVGISTSDALRNMKYAAEHIRSLNDYTDGGAAYEALQRLAASGSEDTSALQPNGGGKAGAVNKSQVKKLFAKYMSEPCKQFEALLSDTVTRSQLDLSMLNECESGDKSVQLDYFGALAGVQVCKSLLDDEDALLRNMIDYIKIDFKVATSG